MNSLFKKHLITSLYTKAPFNTQMYPRIIQLAVYAHQNIMLKHDFINYATTAIENLWLMPFADIYTRRLHAKKLKTSQQLTKTILDYNSSSFIGGGKIINEKHKVSAASRGSNIFEGTFVSQYPCFTINDSTLCPITNIELIIPRKLEFLHVLSYESVSQVHPQVDLVCCIPVNLILHRLTKEALSNMPYVTEDLLYSKISRASLINNIEQQLSTRAGEKLFSVFKFREPKRINVQFFHNGT